MNMSYLAQFERIFVEWVQKEAVDECDCGCPSWCHIDSTSNVRRPCGGCLPCYDLRGRGKRHNEPYDIVRKDAWKKLRHL